MPFLNRAGFVREVEPFDFAVEGVTAISCDIVRLPLPRVGQSGSSLTMMKHKYAFCPKGLYLPHLTARLDTELTGSGSSVIMYRSPELRRYQYYVITDWAGGVYASPSMAGSRPGSILAGAWAVMNHVGAESVSMSHAPRLYTG